MCCSGFLKMMMFIFNGCIFAAGVAILAVGVWVKVDSGSLFGLLDNIENAPDALSQLANVSYLLIGVGAVLLVMGFLGCCGAIKESRCMLLTFFIIVLIIFLAEVAAAVIVLVFENVADELMKSLEDEVVQSIRNDYGSKDSVTELWNGTMQEFRCCGYTGYTDFKNSSFESKFGIYPTACCNATTSSGTIDTCIEEDAESSMIDGCFDRLLQLIKDNALIIGIAALCIAGIEIAAMVVSMILYKKIGDK
ncbi:tetraspanin-1-like [Polymixia lowei]